MTRFFVHEDFFKKLGARARGLASNLREVGENLITLPQTTSLGDARVILRAKNSSLAIVTRSVTSVVGILELKKLDDFGMLHSQDRPLLHFPELIARKFFVERDDLRPLSLLQHLLRAGTDFLILVDDYGYPTRVISRRWLKAVDEKVTLAANSC